MVAMGRPMGANGEPGPAVKKIIIPSATSAKCDFSHLVPSLCRRRSVCSVLLLMPYAVLSSVVTLQRDTAGNNESSKRQLFLRHSAQPCESEATGVERNDAVVETAYKSEIPEGIEHVHQGREFQ